MSWIELKNLIETYSGLERDALHIHAALLIYVVAMGVFRRSRRSRLPWLAVLAFELGNEAHDVFNNWNEEPNLVVAAAARDLWNTMLWPTVLLFVGRYTTWFQRPRPGAEPDPAAASEG